MSETLKDDEPKAARDKFVERYKAWVEEGRQLHIEGDRLGLDCNLNIKPQQGDFKPRRWETEISVTVRAVPLVTEKRAGK